MTNRTWTLLAIAVVCAGCGSKGDSGTPVDTDAEVGTGTGATGTGTGATGTGTGATGAGTGSTTGPWDLHLSGAGYAAYDGQTLWFAVEAADGSSVDQIEVLQEGDTLEITLAGILAEGGNYRVYWAADVDGSGVCESASDVGWGRPFAFAEGDVTLTIDASTQYDDEVCDHLE